MSTSSLNHFSGSAPAAIDDIWIANCLNTCFSRQPFFSLGWLSYVELGSAQKQWTDLFCTRLSAHTARRDTARLIICLKQCAVINHLFQAGRLWFLLPPTSTEYRLRKQTELWWIFHSRGGSGRALMNEIMDPKKGKTSETFLSISRRELGNSIFSSARILTFPYLARLSKKATGERRKKKLEVKL